MPRSGYIAHIRRLIGNELLHVVATAGLIVGADGKLLLQHRADTQDWCAPGGLMEPGEAVTDSLRRELHEETSLDIGDVELFGVYSGPAYTMTYPNGDRIASVILVFTCRDWQGTPRPCEESVALRWCGPDDVPGPLHPHHGPYVEDFWAGTPRVS